MTIKKDGIYKQMLVLAVPMALQELLHSTINMADTLMIGKLGEVEITAVGLANQIFFLYILLCFGITSGAGIFMAQFWGNRDIKNIHKVMGITIISCMLAAILFFVPSVLMPESVISIYSKDPEVIRVGAIYLKTVVFCYPFTSIAIAYRASLRSIGQTRLPIFSTIVALISNISLNAILIFGLFGFPALGVLGAAIATVIARMLETITLVGLVYFYKMDVAAKIKNMLSFNLPFVKTFFMTAGFVIANEIIWSVGVSLYQVAYKETGTQAQAALQIANSLGNLFYMLMASFASAAGIILGNMLGASDIDNAKDYFRKYNKVMPLLGIAAGIIFVAVSSPFLTLFDASKETLYYAQMLIIMSAIAMPVKNVNHFIIVGVLRSGGDTFWSAFIDFSGVWLIGIPMAFLGSYYLRWPIHYIFLLVSIEELYKLIISLKRAYSYKWAKNIVNNVE